MALPQGEKNCKFPLTNLVGSYRLNIVYNYQPFISCNGGRQYGNFKAL